MKRTIAFLAGALLRSAVPRRCHRGRHRGPRQDQRLGRRDADGVGEALTTPTPSRRLERDFPTIGTTIDVAGRLVVPRPTALVRDFVLDSVSVRGFIRGSVLVAHPLLPVGDQVRGQALRLQSTLAVLVQERNAVKGAENHAEKHDQET